MRLVVRFSFFLFVVVGGSTELKAYIDPGAGSMFLQALIGGLLVVGAGLRHYWGRIRSLVPWRGKGGAVGTTGSVSGSADDAGKKS